MDRHPTDRASLERDCLVERYSAGGPGGQHSNKRETAVRLTHLPSGKVVTATERRSQNQNLEVAFERMAQKLIESQRPKKHRRRTRPTGGSIRRRLQNKKQRGEKKALRRKPEH
jgi:protein subunit release factor B